MDAFPSAITRYLVSDVQNNHNQTKDKRMFPSAITRYLVSDEINCQLIAILHKVSIRYNAVLGI